MPPFKVGDTVRDKQHKDRVSVVVRVDKDGDPWVKFPDDERIVPLDPAWTELVP